MIFNFRKIQIILLVLLFFFFIVKHDEKMRLRGGIEDILFKYLQFNSYF